MHFEEHREQVDGIEVASIETGASGYPILFLHGWGGSARSFEPLVEQLRSRFIRRKMVAIDFPGFGHSPPPPSAWGVSDYMECVVKYIRQREFEAVDLVSHSFGGRVATTLVASYPDLVRRVVFIAAAGIRRDEEQHKRTEARAKRLKKLFEFPLLKPFFPFVKRLGYTAIGNTDYGEAEGVMKESFQQVVAEDLRPYLTANTLPTMIFWGEEDSYVPVEDAQIMHQAVPGSALVVFPDGRHGIHKTHAAQIAQELYNFLALRP